MPADQASTPGASNVAQTVTEPVIRASSMLYARIAGSTQWYFEQWEDLLAEAKAQRVGDMVGIGVADILAGMPLAKVVSELPGRVRLRLESIKGQDQLADQSAQAIGSMPGIRQVEASALTGSVLIFYDPARYASRNLLLAAIAGQTK